jgi:protein-disulfide isomerase-like protein with CxxC motif
MVDYSSFIDAVSTSDKAARQSVASDQSPDDAVRAFQLERASGVPAASIAQDIPSFEAEHKAQLGQKIINDNPDISGFINAHPLHGQLVSDDLGSLDEYSRAYRRIAPGGHPLTQFLQGFQEQLQGPEEIKQRAADRWPESLKSWPTVASIATSTIGIPFEMGVIEPFLGLLEGSRRAVKAFGVNAGMDEQGAEKLANELAGMLEYEIQKPSSRMVAEPAAMRPRVAEEILPPEPKPPPTEGLPKPPPTIEGELTSGPTDLSRRSFLQGAASLAASTAVPKVAGKALEAVTKSRLVDPKTPYAIARQTLYGLNEDVGQAADHLLDLAGDAFKEYGVDSLVGRVNTLASELIRSGQVTSSGINVEGMANAIRQQISATRPFLEAGERPPPGVSDAIDEIEAQHTELSSKATDEVIAARDKTALSQRSPEKLEEFTAALPKGTTRIAVDAFVKVPPEKFDWIPDLEQRLQGQPATSTERVKSHAVEVGGEIYEDDTHLGAYNKALKDFGGVDPGGSRRNLFTTDQGRIISQQEAQQLPSVRAALGLPPAMIAPTSITVPTNTYISKIEKEIHDEIKEFVSHGEDLSPVEVKELKENKLPKVTGAGVEIVAKEVLTAANTSASREELQSLSSEADRIDQQLYQLIRAPGEFNQSLAERLHARLNAIRSQIGPVDALQTIRDGAGFNPSPIEKPTLPTVPANHVRFYHGGSDPQSGGGRWVSPHFAYARDYRPGEPVNYVDIPQEWLNQKFPDTELYIGEYAQPYPSFEAPEEFAKKMLPAEGGPPSKPPEEPPPLEGEPPSSPKRIFSKAKAFGRTEKEYTAYEKLIAQRDAEDVEWRLRRAQAQAERENSKAWKDEARSIRDEVKSEVSSRPEIAAYRFFQDGEAFGNKLARRPKINEQSLTPEQRSAFPKQFIAPRGRGYDPDAVANLFGFSDGDTLVAAISAIEKEATAGRGDIVDRLVDAEVNRRVDAKLGETAKERLDEAYDHALSATQLEMIHERMLQLGTQVGTSISIPPMATKLGALNLLHQELFGGMSSRRFLNDAGRFERRVEKALLEGDPIEAFKSAQAQYIAAEMAKEARQVEKEAKVFDRLEKRYRKREVEGRDPAYTNWIHDILNQIGEGRRDPNDIRTKIEEASEKTLQEFIDARAAMGRAIYMPQFLLDRQAKNLDDMTVLEARQTFATLRSLDKNSRDETQVVTATGKIDLKNLLDQMAEKLETLGVATQTENMPGKWNEFRNGLRWYNAQSLQVETILNRWDRFDAFGIFNRWIGQPLLEAATYESSLQREISKDYINLPNQLKIGESSKTVPNTIFRSPKDAWKSAEGKYDFSNASPLPLIRSNLRAILLNVGNPSNLKKLAEGYQIKPEQIMDWLNTYAKKEDWDWAQAHGKMFEKLKKLSDVMRSNMYGVAPESVDVQPIQTPHGTYDGWYHPVIFDPVWKGQRVAASKASDLFVGNNPWSRPNTPAAYTYERTNYVAPIDLVLDQVPARLAQEIHDIAFHEPVVNAAKIIMDPKNRFANTVAKHYGKTYADLFEPWLRDVANARNYNSVNQEMGAWAQTYLRTNWINSAVGLSLSTIEKHTPTAAANSIKEIGPRYFANAAGSLFNEGPVRGENNWKFAMRTFDELGRRHQNWMENISGAQEAMLDPRGLEAARQMASRIGSAPVAFLDLLSAVPTALGGWKKALDEGRSPGEAVIAGNRAVRRAHGSTAITSRPAIMREHPNVTYLYNFMSRMYQYGFEYGAQAKDALTGQAEGKKLEYAKNIFLGAFVTIYFMGMVETVVSDTEEDETWESFAGKSLLNGVTSPLIGVRQLVHAIMHKSDPAFGLGGEEMKRLTDLVRDIRAKNYGLTPDHAARTIKHTNDLFALITGLSNAEIGNMQEYLYDLDHGRVQPTGTNWWRGIRRGRVGKPTSEENFLKLLTGGKR